MNINIDDSVFDGNGGGISLPKGVELNVKRSRFTNNGQAIEVRDTTPFATWAEAISQMGLPPRLSADALIEGLTIINQLANRPPVEQAAAAGRSLLLKIGDLSRTALDVGNLLLAAKNAGLFSALGF